MEYKNKETAFNGIWLWVQDNRHDLIRDRPINKEQSNLRKLIKRFLIENDLLFSRRVSNNYNNIQVQKNFKKFKEWIYQL